MAPSYSVISHFDAGHDTRTIPFVPVPTIDRLRGVNWEAKNLQNSQGEQHATRCF